MPPKTRRHASKDNARDVSETSDEENHAVANRAGASTSATPTAERGSNMIAISEDQLTRLLSNVMRSVATPTPMSSNGESTGPTHPTIIHTGAPNHSNQHSNFTRCTARFDGAARGAEALEAFVENVLVYKECANVSDEHALRGLSMLLTGDAAVWWQGIKSTVESWDEAIRRLRFMYGAPRPPHRILRETFAKDQSESDSVDSFISRVRANLSRIPYSISERMQLDIIYGLLNRKIRKRVSRDSVSSVDCLLERARYVEETLNEVSPSKSLLNSSRNHNNSNKTRNDNNNPPNATVVQNNPSHATPDSSSNTTSTVANSKHVRPRCAFCKRFGHSVDECRNKQKSNEQSVENAPLSCYGCGRQGVIRSKCPTCKGTPPATADKVSFQSAVTCVTDLTHSTIKIEVASLVGVAVLDTGATESLASPGLYKVLLASGNTFTRTHRNIGLADGTQQVRELFSCNTNVTVQGRIIPTTFLAIPEANNRTLLGQDFIARAGILLDLQHNCWHFCDSPGQKFTFVQTYSLTSASDAELMQVNTTSPALREDEGTKLSPAQRMQLNQLITSRAERFATEGPPTTYATHRIRVDEKQEPTASPPYRMSQGKRQLLEGELEKLLEADVIEECESPWAANVVLVTKKDGGVRLCVDYRKLNAVTEPDRYPLPRIEDVLHAAKTTGYMTTLDLHSGYFQVSVSEEDRDKTAFVTPFGTYRFKRMPMGLRNSGATFQRLIDRFKSNLNVPHVLNQEPNSNPQGGRPVTILGYLDDLIILSQTFESHMEDLEAVFDRLEKFSLRVNRKKSCFARDSVKFLGHIIVPGGLQVDPEKTSAIADMPAPKNERQLKGFLATSSWFRRFVPNYAAVAKPLTDLLKKNSSWKWHEEQQSSFERIKELLITAPILRQADESQPFSLRTDSSGYCLSAVLMQGEGSDVYL